MREAKAASISLSVPALRIGSCTPFARGYQMAFFAKTVRDVVGVLFVVLNEQDFQVRARYLGSPRLFAGSSL